MQEHSHIGNPYHLERFVTAQENVFQTALSEVAAGRKQSHWMWFIFPQIQGLGFSETARYYGIKNEEEAAAFLSHPVLGSRLIAICKVLVEHTGTTAHKIFGSPDDLKLKSSMTLFAALHNSDPVFQAVLDMFFDGKKDTKTLGILKHHH